LIDFPPRLHFADAGGLGRFDLSCCALTTTANVSTIKIAPQHPRIALRIGSPPEANSSTPGRRAALFQTFQVLVGPLQMTRSSYLLRAARKPKLHRTLDSRAICT